MDEQKQKLIERIRQAQNILVTVSANPSVDQLAAAIGLTLTLNKLDKHGTAVFSGQVPSTLEFLKPEETLEKNTDSLRDFIIALDKSKADKLRYKVEDQVVRIFITPYKTSLSENDLEFSQGDFNVDVVICLGVTEQQDLDAAITAHGRILHDATVASISTQGQGSLGTINWVDPNASSLSEMMVSLADGLDKKAIDNQIATAYLTGIVAATERFRNEKTTPRTMSASATLMAAGANQQLIATELETPPAMPEPPAPDQRQGGDAYVDSTASTPPPQKDPGTLEIEHDSFVPEPPEPAVPEPASPQVQVDENGQLLIASDANKIRGDEAPLPPISHVRGVAADGEATESGKTEVKRERIVEPPKLGATDLTANTSPEDLEPSTEELTLPAMNAPLLSHNETVLSPLSPSSENLDSNSSIPPAPPAPTPAAPAPVPLTPPAPAMPPTPVTPPVWQPPSLPSQPPMPPAPTLPPAPSPTPTLNQIEQSVDSPHVHITEDGTLTNSASAAATPAPAGSVDDARSAVEAALSRPDAPSDPLQPIVALNAQPLGPNLHAAPAPSAFVPPPAPANPVPNTGFSEPTPGNTPADDTLDMPLPSNPFGPGQQQQPLPPPPPGIFENPQTPPQQDGQNGQTPPPPVPPPMLPPLR